MKTTAVFSSHNKTNLALTALITGAVAIGFSAIFVRLSEVGPIATAFWRMSLSLPAFWLWLTLSAPPAPADRRPISATDYRWLVATGLFFTGDLAAWHWAIHYTTVANAVLLANFAPIFVTLGGWLFFRQRVTLRFIGGMLLAIAGAALLIGASFNLSPGHLLGDLLGLTTAVFYGGYILSVKRLRDSLPTATIMLWAAAITSALLLPLALLTEPALAPLSVGGWAVLLGLALFSHTGGQGLITFALAHLPASFSSVTLLLQPVLSALFAWLLLNEALAPAQMAGGLIVLAGIFIARRASQLGS